MPVSSKAKSITVPGDPVKTPHGVVRTPARKLSPARTARLIAARERASNALELRKAGLTYAEIAKALGYADNSGAERAVKKAIDRLGLEAAKDVVLMDLARLDEFQKRCTASLREGDLSQIDRIMRIMTMRHNLLGITSDSYREAVAKQTGTAITNNGVMVIQGTETEFVRSMMEAVGVDPESDEGKKEMKKIVAKRRKERKQGGTAEEVGVLAIEAPRTVEAMEKEIPPAAAPQEETIIDAEIVEEDI